VFYWRLESFWVEITVLLRGRYLLRHHVADPSNRGHQYAIETVQTPCNFGGSRRWFRCPNCGTKTGKLYLPPDGTAFLCRTCHGLTYRSVQTHDARVDALARLPYEQLDAILAAGGRRSLLAVAARNKQFESLRRTQYL
jgi:hypothetical protein